MNTARLGQIVARDNFELSYDSLETGEIVFVRKSAFADDIFDRVSIHSSKPAASQEWNYFAANAELSLVPGRTAVKQICETRFIANLPFAGDRGSSHLPNEESEFAWQTALGKRLSEEMDQLFSASGRRLLHDTAELRRVTSLYYSYYDTAANPQRFLKELELRLDSHCCNAVRCLPSYGVITIPRHTLSFQIALGLICLYSDKIEPSRVSIGLSQPYENYDLFLRLQILASRIAKERGWKNAGHDERSASG